MERSFEPPAQFEQAFELHMYVLCRAPGGENRTGDTFELEREGR